MSDKETALAAAFEDFKATVTELGFDPAYTLRFWTRSFRRQMTGGYRNEVEQVTFEADILATVPGIERKLEVLAAPYGTPDRRDSKGQFFSPKTRLFEDFFERVPVLYCHSFGEAQPSVIGEARFLRRDDAGAWYSVELYFEQEQAVCETLWRAAHEHACRASVGTAPMFHRVAPDGEILAWPIVELSLLDTRAGDIPANWAAAVFPVVNWRPQEAAATELVDNEQPTGSNRNGQENSSTEQHEAAPD